MMHQAKFLILALLLGIVFCTDPAIADDDLKKETSWSPPTPTEIQQSVVAWLEGAKVEDALKSKSLSVLGEQLKTTGNERLDIVLTAMQPVRPEILSIRSWVDKSINKREILAGHSDIKKILADENESEFLKSHVRLLYARQLAQHELYDEALSEFKKLQVGSVLDPGTLLFYRGLAEHQLLKKDECLKTMNQLLENADKIPRRFLILGRLVSSDIEPVEADSLDEISRLMRDIQRRQNLHRSGKIVRDQEEEVIRKLDKLIEEIESQQQMQQQAGGKSSSNTPMEDSRNASGKGSGEVTQQEQPEGGVWGNLPPAERAQALAEMAKDLPPHYRGVIEEYFRQLAKEQDQN